MTVKLGSQALKCSGTELPPGPPQPNSNPTKSSSQRDSFSSMGYDYSEMSFNLIQATKLSFKYGVSSPNLPPSKSEHAHHFLMLPVKSTY